MGIEIQRIDEQWILEIAETHHRWIGEQDKRDRDADQRHKELMRIHADGWKGVAGAIERGLGSIADALRQR